MKEEVEIQERDIVVRYKETRVSLTHHGLDPLIRRDDKTMPRPLSNFISQ